MTSRRGPGERAGLTQEVVLDAATRLLIEKGAPALTMRGLAGRLGVAPNALYSHVADKTELLDGVLDSILAAVDLGTDESDPTAALAQIIRSTYRVLIAHPTVVPLYLARQGARGVNAQRLGDEMDKHLHLMGVVGVDVEQARRVLIVHAIGSAAFDAAAEDNEIDPASDAAFDVSLNWLLTGIAS